MTTIHDELADARWTAEELAELASVIDTSAAFPRPRSMRQPDAAENAALQVAHAVHVVNLRRRDVKTSEGKPSAAKWARELELARYAVANAFKSAGIPTV